MKTKKRKSQQLSITFIILAVIGLIVLVIMIAIFTRESGRTVTTLGDCAVRGGERTSGACEGGKIMPEIECKGKGYVCCYTLDE